MTKNMPFISVVCPTYNSAGFVLKTIESLVNQTYSQFEIIISDDGSVDNTCEIIEDYFKKSHFVNYKILKNKHAGVAATRNAGIKAASGQWIAFIDSDDQWFPNKLATVAKAIQEHPEVNFICNTEEFVRLDGRKELFDFGAWYNVHKLLPDQLLKRCIFATSAVICRRDLLLAVGCFDEKLSLAEDYDLWLKLSPLLKVFYIREVSGYYFERKGNLSSRKAWRWWLSTMQVLWRHHQKTSFLNFLYYATRHTASILKRKALKITD